LPRGVSDQAAAKPCIALRAPKPRGNYFFLEFFFFFFNFFFGGQLQGRKKMIIAARAARRAFSAQAQAVRSSAPA
jgi:hypothetical protein